MKLLSLYIDNFGKISDFSYNFINQINTIYEENGWGKTTISIFIKSMLYGLNKQDRSKYAPWKNVTGFGGNIVFEVDNIIYRVDRQFNYKKASLDTFRIYDVKTGKELSDFESNLGEKFLNLNESSFERSVYIPEYDIKDGFGNDIEAKLANLIGGMNDTKSYDKALTILTNKLHQIKLNSKKGELIDKKNEIIQVESELDDCISKVAGVNLIKDSLEIKNNELLKLNNKKKELNNKIIEYSKNQDAKSKLAVLNKYREDYNLTKNELYKNNEIFNGYGLSIDELMIVREKNKGLISLKKEYQWMSDNDSNLSEKLEDLKGNLSKSNFPTDEDIINIDKKIEKFNKIKGAISIHEEVEDEKKPLGGIISLVISSIILALGIFLLTYSIIISKNNLLLIGIILLVFSTLGYILTLTLFMIYNNKKGPKKIDSVKSYDYELRRTEEEIREFFSKFHLYSNDYSNNLYLVRSTMQKYNELQKEFEKNNKNRNDLESKIKEIKNDIDSFLIKFKTTALTNEEKIGELNTHLRNKDDIEKSLKDKELKIENYIKENKLNELNKSYDVDVNKLNQQIENIDQEVTELHKQIASDSNKIIEYERDILYLDELKLKLEDLKEEVNNLKEEYNLLELTIDFLTKSQNLLLEKYVQPMKTSVTKYINMMLKTSDYTIDTKFKFQFITNYGLKDLEMYSRGIQAIISLCMRLALIDCLYPNEKPFIVFDDPFSSFDDEKLILCKNLLTEVSKQYQIIYFTCHDSRKIN